MNARVPFSVADTGEVYDVARSVLFVSSIGFERKISRNLVVQLRGSSRKRVFWMNDRRQIAIFDFDEVGGVLCRRRALCDDECDALTDEVNLAVSEHRPIGRARFHAIPAGESQRVRRFGVARLHRVFTGKNLLHAGMVER